MFAICFFGSVILALLASYLLARVSSNNFLQKRSDLHSILFEYINGLPDLIVNQSGATWLKKISLVENVFQRGEIKNALATGISNGLILLLSHGSMLLILIAAGTLVQTGQLEGKSLAACALLTLAAFDALQPLSLAAQQLVLTNQALDRVMLPELSNIAGTSLPTNYPPVKSPELIRCEQLTFQNNPSRDFSLDDISLDWHSGEWIALVGPSGAGKTTLARLLLGYWQTYTGEIEYDSMSSKLLSPEWIRSQVAYSGQSAFFINDTLRANLAIARNDLHEAEMITALEICQLMTWFQALPEGLETQLGEHGTKLSEGERRRLDLARMILRDTPFLIFDEPLAGLDSMTEHDLIASLRVALQIKGVLWITHRISGLEGMDQILVLDHGILVQQGKWADLAVQDGMFKQMLSIQTRIIQ